MCDRSEGGRGVDDDRSPRPMPQVPQPHRLRRGERCRRNSGSAREFCSGVGDARLQGKRKRPRWLSDRFGARCRGIGTGSGRNRQRGAEGTRSGASRCISIAFEILTAGTDQNAAIHLYTHERACPEARSARGRGCPMTRGRGSARGLVQCRRGRTAEQREPVVDPLSGQALVSAGPLVPSPAPRAQIEPGTEQVEKALGRPFVHIEIGAQCRIEPLDGTRGAMALVQHRLDGLEQRCARRAELVLQCPVGGEQRRYSARYRARAGRLCSALTKYQQMHAKCYGWCEVVVDRPV